MPQTNHENIKLVCDNFIHSEDLLSNTAKKAGVVTKVYHEYALFYMLLVYLSNIFPLCRDLECLFIAELRRRLVEFNAENNLMRTIY